MHTQYHKDGTILKAYRVNSKLGLSLFKAFDLSTFWIPKRKFPRLVKKILILRNDQLGDVVMTIPLILTIKQMFPEAHIDVMVRKSSKILAEMIPDKTIKFIALDTPWFARGPHDGWKSVFKFIKSHKKYYDIVVDPHADVRNAYLARRVGKFSIGFADRGGRHLIDAAIPYYMHRHVVDNMHDIPVKLALLSGKDSPKKVFPKKPAVPKVNVPKTYLIVHPISGMESKNWSLERWAQVVEQLCTKHNVICCDPNSTDYLKKHVKHKRFHTISCSLMEYARVIAHAKLLVSVDTVAVHIASVYNTPVLSLHAAISYVEEWGPFGKKSGSLTKTSCPHHPCHSATCLYKTSFSPCMQDISVDEVLSEVKKKI